MKNRLAPQKLIVLFLSVIAIVFYFSPKCIAICEETDKNKAENEFYDSVDEKIAGLDADDFEKYYESLTSEEKDVLGFGTIKALISYVSKNGLSTKTFRSFFSLTAKSMAKGLTSLLPAFVSVMIISVLSGLLRGLTSDLLKKETSEVICIVLYVAAVLTVLGTLVPMLNTVKLTVGRVKKLSEAIFPVLTVLTTALGGTVSAGIYSPLTVCFSSVLIALIDAVILPCFIAVVVFSVVGNVSENVKLEKMTGFFKSFSSWLLGISFSLFVSFATFQGVSGAAVDGAKMSAAKKLVSGSVPIVGDYLTDGFDIALVSTGLIKNSVGLTGVLVLAATTLAPLIKIVAFLLLSRLTSAVSEAVGDKKISAMLSGMAKSASLLVSTLAGITFVFTVLLMLMIFTFNPGV